MGHHHQIPRPPAHDGLDVIFSHGNRAAYRIDGDRLAQTVRNGRNWVRCHDGFIVSIAAGGGMHCISRDRLTKPHQFGLFSVEPKPPYIAVEVAYPNARPEPWDLWSLFAQGEEDEAWNCIYPYVPVGLVRYLVGQHGGFHKFLRLSERIPQKVDT